MDFFNEFWLIGQLQFLIVLVLSLTVHEWAHAWSAWRLGDQTAFRQGRVSLDPRQHIDPVGSLLLPLLGIPFGWARPVPINPGQFGRGVSLPTGLFLTAAAGPASNICLAFAAAITFGLAIRLMPSSAAAYRPLAEQVVFLNALLAAFNLLPIPPLDGSRILDTIVPDHIRPAWDQLAAYGPLLLVLALVVPPILGFPLFELPFEWASELLSFAAGG